MIDFEISARLQFDVCKLQETAWSAVEAASEKLNCPRNALASASDLTSEIQVCWTHIVNNFWEPEKEEKKLKLN